MTSPHASRPQVMAPSLLHPGSDSRCPGRQCRHRSVAALRRRTGCRNPVEDQRYPSEPAEPAKSLRTLHFGQHHEGLVTFLVYPPDDLVLVVQIQWLGE